MSKESLHMNNPLQGVSLKVMLEELVTYYGFDILYAYLNMNCFKANPSIAASAKFLKKTDWAREKVEVFYLYQYKNLPGVSSEQFNVAPRERIVPDHQKPGEPAILSIEDAHRLQQKRDKNAASRDRHTGEPKESSRKYNDRHSARHNSPYDNNHAGVEHASTTDDSRASQSDDSNVVDEPEANRSASAFNPWGNYKKKK